MTRSSSPSSQTMKHYVGVPADLQKQAAEAQASPRDRETSPLPSLAPARISGEPTTR
jgi:hypothetical protein